MKMSRISHLLGNVAGENRKVVVGVMEVKSTTTTIQPGSSVYWVDNGRNKILDVLEMGTESRMLDALRASGSFSGYQMSNANNFIRTPFAKIDENQIVQGRNQNSNTNKRKSDSLFIDEKRPNQASSRKKPNVMTRNKQNVGKLQPKNQKHQNDKFDCVARRKPSKAFEVLGLELQNDDNDETQYESPIRSTGLRSPAFSDDDADEIINENTLSSPKSQSIFNPAHFHDYYRRPPSPVRTIEPVIKKNKTPAPISATKLHEAETSNHVPLNLKQSRSISTLSKEYNPPPLCPISTNVDETPRSRENAPSKIRINVTSTRKSNPNPSLPKQNTNNIIPPVIQRSPTTRSTFQEENRNIDISPVIQSSPSPRSPFHINNNVVHQRTLQNNSIGNRLHNVNRRIIPAANGHYTQETVPPANVSPRREQIYIHHEHNDNQNGRNASAGNVFEPRPVLSSRQNSTRNSNANINGSAQSRHSQNQNEEHRDAFQNESVNVPVGILKELMNRISQIENKTEKSWSILAQGFPLFADTKHDHRPGEIHIGSGVYIQENDHLAVESSIGKPLEAVKKLAVCVFGRDHLATHNRTGQTSNAHRHLEAKGKLNETKLNAITNYVFTKFRAQKSDRMHLGHKGKMVELTLEDLERAVGEHCSYLYKRRRGNSVGRRNPNARRFNGNNSRNNNNNNNNTARHNSSNENSPGNERQNRNRTNRQNNNRIDYGEYEENDYDDDDYD